MICPRCGQPGETGRHCARCGLFLAPPTRLETPGDRVGPVQPAAPTSWAGPPPTRQFPTQQFAAPPPGWGGVPGPTGPPGGRGARTALIVVSVVALLAVAGGVVAFLTLGGSGGSGPLAATTTAVAPPSPAGGSPSSTANGIRGTSKSQVGGTAAATSGPTPAPSPTSTAATTVAAATGLSDVTAQAIACDSGYVVQLASETTPEAFVARVDAVRAAGQLPAGSRWADTTASCPGLFTATAQVLYAGPFAGPYDGCPTRLVGPWDAFVKNVADPSAFLSCLCPQDPNGLPVVAAVGQQDAWIGELQRMLRNKLDYQGIDIDARPADGFPGAWGVYTQSTADAVTRFQADRGLPTTGQVDAGTWAALRSAGC